MPGASSALQAVQVRAAGARCLGGLQQRSINLTFHGIGAAGRHVAAGEADVWVSRESCLALLDAAAERGDVRLTFDDGNASDVEHALPALRERGLSATFFVVAGRLGTPGYLDEAGVRELAAAGMGVGCHGMRHRPWRRLDEATLREELVEAKQRLEAIVERPVTQAACPFGAYDRRTLHALRRHGYREVYTSDRGTARPDGWLRPRNTVRDHDGPDLLQRIVRSERPAYKTLPPRAKRMAKSWR
jgi:peptidoglycan/xylan/chitin deacetylase (PgdA/CDA1 family)